MPYRLYMYERRDNSNRNDMAIAALGMCRAIRKTKDINSARFYWSGFDSVAILIEGNAINAPVAGAAPEDSKFWFDMADAARLTMDIQLTEAKAGEEAAKTAGRA